MGIFSQRRNNLFVLNDNFFAIPTLLNSYWAGFLAADGCITSSTYRDSYLSIGLSIKDKEHLELLNTTINSSYKIHEYYSNCAGKKYHSCKLVLYRSKNIVSDLCENFNLTPKKSLTLEPPANLTNDQALAFIIGYIDGDGCIIKIPYKEYKNGKYINRVAKHYTLSILGTEKFLNWIKGTLQDNFNTKIVSTVIKQKGNFYKISISGKLGLALLKELSKIKVPKLERKWDKIKETLNGQ